MVNASLNFASLCGIFLGLLGLLLLIRSGNRINLFIGIINIICGLILFFQGWRLDPILQFSQSLLVGSNAMLTYIIIKR